MIKLEKKKAGAVVAEEKSGQTEPKFTKQQVLASARYRNRKDLVSALLDDGREYTIAEVDRMVDGFMKGKVK